MPLLKRLLSLFRRRSLPPDNILVRFHGAMAADAQERFQAAADRLVLAALSWARCGGTGQMATFRFCAMACEWRLVVREWAGLGVYPMLSARSAPLLMAAIEYAGSQEGERRQTWERMADEARILAGRRR